MQGRGRSARHGRSATSSRYDAPQLNRELACADLPHCRAAALMPVSLVLAVAIVFAAGAISGLAGFGFALVAVPPLLLVFEPPTVVVLTKVLALATSWIVLLDSWRAIRWRTVAALLPWAMVSQFVGIAALSEFDAAGVKLLASAVVVGFAVLLLIGRAGGHPSIADRLWATPLAGTTSGVLSTSTGLSGP